MKIMYVSGVTISWFKYSYKIAYIFKHKNHNLKKEL